MFDYIIPSDETIPVALQIESSDGDFARDYRMDGGASVTYHENEFAVGKDVFHVARVAEYERVFVA